MTAIVGVLIVTVLIRIFVLPTFGPAPLPDGTLPKDPKWLTTADSILNSLFVSLTVTVSIGLFLFSIELPDEEKKFEIIEPFKLGELFENERSRTEIWYFTGGLGRHTRAVTIPALAKLAQSANQHKIVKIQLINPDDEKVCSDYANYRRALKSASKNSGKWTISFVKRECTATIIAAALYKNEFPLLELTICLKNNFSTLRIDISSKVAIITKEDPSEPALVCREGSFLYRTYKEELLQTFKEYKIVDTNVSFPYKASIITGKQAKEVAEKLRIGIDLDDDDFEDIATIIRTQDNPYA